MREERERGRGVRGTDISVCWCLTMVVMVKPVLLSKLPTSASWTNGDTCAAKPCVITARELVAWYATLPL